MRTMAVVAHRNEHSRAVGLFVNIRQLKDHAHHPGVNAAVAHTVPEDGVD